MKRWIVALVVSLVFAGALCAAGLFTPPEAGGQEAKSDGKYMGVEKCKKCHEAKAAGSQYSKWKETKHAKAWDALATDEAKKVAKEKGIDDPQKSDACVKCHVTGHGVDAAKFDKSFDPKLGIQCESCHGPAEKHIKARMADEDEDEKSIHAKAQKEMPLPDMKTLCVKCHNADSPSIEKSTFWNKEKKEFDVEKAIKEIEHPNPKWHK